MGDAHPGEGQVLSAGNFSSWLSRIQLALGGERGSDVPCGSCAACCTASQFIHVGPDETDARAHIPSELLFPAPGLPNGHALLGYDEHGRCPMLVDDQCSIYEHRPRTCRTYDCRVFPAAGLEVDDDKPLIAGRARRWRFGYPRGCRPGRARGGPCCGRLPEGPCLRPRARGPRQPDPARRARHRGPRRVPRPGRRDRPQRGRWPGTRGGPGRLDPAPPVRLIGASPEEEGLVGTRPMVEPVPRSSHEASARQSSDRWLIGSEAR